METGWLIDFYGGAAIISAEDYFGASAQTAAPKADEIQCPVSGESFVPAADQPSVEFANGQKIFFCCPNCVEQFTANASAYIAA